MSCPVTSSDSWLSCVGVAPLFSEQEVSTYADRVGAQGAPWIRPITIAMLRANRMIYWKNSPNGLTGDCGSNTGLALNTDQTISRVAGKLAASDPEPISGGILAGVSQILGFFGAAHAKAVVNEQSTLCTVASNYDQFANAMEQALQTGQIPLQDATLKLQQLQNGLAGYLTQIEKQYNAAYGYHKALNALVLLNTEKVYPMLSSGGSSSEIFLVAAAAIGAKLVGLF